MKLVEAIAASLAIMSLLLRRVLDHSIAYMTVVEMFPTDVGRLGLSSRLLFEESVVCAGVVLVVVHGGVGVVVEKILFILD